MSRPEKRVPLSRAYAIHGEAVREIVLKEPTWDDYAELGELFEAQPGPGGTRLVVENREAVKAYVERCVGNIQPSELGMLGLADARALRSALIGFFHNEPSSTPPSTGSSSPTDGAPATSAA